MRHIGWAELEVPARQAIELSVPSSVFRRLVGVGDLRIRAGHGHDDADIEDIRCGDRPTVLAHRPGSTAAWAWT